MMALKNDFVRRFRELIDSYSWRMVDTALGIFMFLFIVLPVFVFWLIGKMLCPELVSGESYDILRYILFVFYVAYLVGLLRAFCVCGAVNNRRRLQQLKEKFEASESIDEKRREEIRKEIIKLTKQCDRILGDEQKS